MKLIVIPPYKNVKNYSPEEGQFMAHELLANMKKKGQLEGVDVDVDDAFPTEHPGTNRDEEFLAYISVGVIKKVREYSEMGEYDGIVLYGSIEPGFFGARLVSRIPVATAVHSAVHVASLIGDRFTIIEATDPQTQIVRHFVQVHGLGHKLASVRHVSYSSTATMGFVRKYKKEERSKVPEVKKFIENIVAQCKDTIERDRVDSIIIGCIPLQCFEDEIRQGLDKAGYDEIQIIHEFSAALEMTKAMVNMRLIQAPRAYPGDSLKAKPEFR
jgi:Asp/Glu/hydantoin racemase